MGLCGETKIVNNMKTQIDLACECYISTMWLKLLSPYSVVLLVYLVVSVCIISKHQKVILFIGFLSEIAVPRAFACAHLFLNIAMNIGKSSLLEYVVAYRSCSAFCHATLDATS